MVETGSDFLSGDLISASLNACVAVLRFKQIRGFYFEELSQHHLLFGVGDLKVAGDAETKQD
jgi:hypothetical protein